MLHSGYLLSELMVGVLIIALSATTFVYYGYQMACCQSDAIRECYAISLASSYLDALVAKGYKETHVNQVQKGDYSLDVSIKPIESHLHEEGEKKYQKRFRVIEIKVTWKTSKKVLRKVKLLSGMIADEEKRI